MSEAVVAKRYADALFQLAGEKSKLNDIQDELTVVQEVFQANPKLKEVLEHPQVKQQDKMALIDEAFGSCQKEIVHTIKLLVERQRITYIAEIIEYYNVLFNEANGVAAATVYSVRALNEEEKANVEASLTKQLNKKKIAIENIVDPSILGGLKVRVGNTIYDGSINGKLNRIKNNIVSVSN